ncbi:hypothetical protein [Nocardia tengchongensis]|uniref:hypothetical protein n=1 Tax=Nocardia tengchongensis TaxID=2055889 RepID=UPI00368DECBB
MDVPKPAPALHGSRWGAAGKWVADRLPRFVMGFAGLALLAAGAVRIFSVEGTTGPVALLVVGILLLASPDLARRIERLKVDSTGFEMHIVRDLQELGASKAAAILNNTELAVFAESYTLAHEELAAEEFRPAKIHLQDLLVTRAATCARRNKFDAAEVRALFKNGTPTLRVLALGLMRGDISLADGPTVISGIAKPASNNEQYVALVLAERCWRRLSAAEQSAVHTMAREIYELAQEGSLIQASGGRARMAQKLVDLPIGRPRSSHE